MYISDIKPKCSNISELFYHFNIHYVQKAIRKTETKGNKKNGNKRNKTSAKVINFLYMNSDNSHIADFKMQCVKYIFKSAKFSCSYFHTFA